jgi:hypothetical protein
VAGCCECGDEPSELVKRLPQAECRLVFALQVIVSDSSVFVFVAHVAPSVAFCSVSRAHVLLSCVDTRMFVHTWYVTCHKEANTGLTFPLLNKLAL